MSEEENAEAQEAEAPKPEVKKPEPPPEAPAKKTDVAIKADFKPRHYEKPKQGVMGKLFSKGKIGANEFVTDGNILLNERDYDGAMAAFETALSGDNTLTEGYVGLGKAYAGLGGVKNAKAAVQYFYKALEADYTREEIYDAIVKMYQRLGDDKRAHIERKKLQTVRALRSDPHNAVANNNLGAIQLGQKHFDGAIRSFTKATKGQACDHISQFNLANAWFQKASLEEDAHEKKGQLARAYKEIETFMQHKKTCQGELLKAKIYMVFGDYNKALISCNAAIQLDATHKEALNTKIAIDEHLGNISEASEGYKDLQSLKKGEGKG
ncbi:MAG: hypothetical protein QNL04_02885 [SAR324 cluster bacterium]|nr:hypothetical protein [SAR324 cluster bacterium]